MSRTSESHCTVLVLTSGDGTGLNFTRSLRRAGGYRIIGLDTSLDDHVASEGDERVLAEEQDHGRLLQIINDVATASEADLIYAADTNDLLWLVSRERDHLAAPVFLPDLDDHMLAEDKWRTYEHLSSAGLPVPPTRLARNVYDLEEALDEHGTVWLRRTTGSGGAGSLATGSLDLAKAWIDEFRGWGQFTVAKQLSLRTATFSGLWLEGDLIASQLRERTAWKYPHLTQSGVTGITGGQKTIWDQELHELAVDCVQACMARPHGAIGVDFTYGRDGRPYATEIQPARFYSSMEFLAAAGINLPDLYCRTAGGTVPPMNIQLINPIRNTFYWFKSVDKMPQLLSQEQLDEHKRGELNEGRYGHVSSLSAESGGCQTHTAV